MRPQKKLKVAKLEKNGPSSFKLKPVPASFIIENLLMKKFNVDAHELSERTGIPESDLKKMLSGQLALDKKMVVRLRRVFGKAVRPLLRVDRLYNYYKITGNVHSGRRQIVVPKGVVNSRSST